MQTNVTGTFSLLEEARAHWSALPAAEKAAFRFLHVSTDEVYGSLGADDPAFSEQTPYAPNSPYAASKAASDHLVRAYHHTYGLPALTTNCSNNYGPYQFPEKLIPLVIHNALAGKPLPVYGDGKNVRDWLYVLDHCAAVRLALDKGRPGETYNIGGSSERTNIDVVQQICAILDRAAAARRRALRGPGHVCEGPPRPRPPLRDRQPQDPRRAWLVAAGELRVRTRENCALVPRQPRLDGGHYERRLPQLGGAATTAQGQEASRIETVRWYLANRAWTEDITSGAYRSWVERNYGTRGQA